MEQINPITKHHQFLDKKKKKKKEHAIKQELMNMNHHMTEQDILLSTQKAERKL